MEYYKSEFYQKLIKIEDNNGEIAIITTDSLNRESIYSWYNVKNKTSPSFYINKCILGGIIGGDFSKVLVIGAGGGAFIKYIEDHFQGVEITGIDIDKTMYEIAKSELGIKCSNLLVGDYKEIIKKLIKNNRKYDFILFDIYGSDGEIPEFGENEVVNIKAMLSEKGVFSINYSNYYLENIENDRIIKYKKIHNNLKNILNNDFLSIVSNLKKGGNVVGIYNLGKKYSINDIKKIYFEKTNFGNILFDENILENLYIDNGIYLN